MGWRLTPTASAFYIILAPSRASGRPAELLAPLIAAGCSGPRSNIRLSTATAPYRLPQELWSRRRLRCSRSWSALTRDARPDLVGRDSDRAPSLALSPPSVTACIQLAHTYTPPSHIDLAPRCGSLMCGEIWAWERIRWCHFGRNFRLGDSGSMSHPTSAFRSRSSAASLIHPLWPSLALASPQGTLRCRNSVQSMPGHHAAVPTLPACVFATRLVTVTVVNWVCGWHHQPCLDRGVHPHPGASCVRVAKSALGIGALELGSAVCVCVVLGARVRTRRMEEAKRFAELVCHQLRYGLTSGMDGIPESPIARRPSPVAGRFKVIESTSHKAGATPPRARCAAKTATLPSLHQTFPHSITVTRNLRALFHSTRAISHSLSFLLILSLLHSSHSPSAIHPSIQLAVS